MTTISRYTTEVIEAMTPAEIFAEINSLERIASGDVEIPGYSRLFAINDLEALKTWV